MLIDNVHLSKMEDEEAISNTSNTEFCDDALDDSSSTSTSANLSNRGPFVDFPFIVTTTDKGNVMLVTDSETSGFRHHWSLHSRRPQKDASNPLSENGSGCCVLQRFACIKCKQQSRDNNACMFASCLSIIQFPSGEIFLKTHPWTGIRPHVCPGIPVDESDALLLLRHKRQDIVKLKSKPKDAFEELMREVDSMPNWDEEKRQRIRVLIGSKQRNERTFQRCLLKGKRVAAAAAAATTTATSGSDTDNCGSSLNFDDSCAYNTDSLNFDLNTEFADYSGEELAGISGSVLAARGNELIQSLMHNGLGGIFFSGAAGRPAQNHKSSLNKSVIEPVVVSTKILNESDLSFCSSTPSTMPEQADVQANVVSSMKREFNFSNYPQRRIALLFLYYGWEFDGLVAQPDTRNTVEEHLFNALIKTRLIKDRDSCQWTRCGRTDKGVSAFKQVAAITVRSNDISGHGVFWPMDSNPAHRVKSTTEHNFAKMLNGVLPKSIRVIGWCPTHRDFNARFNCTDRTYTYIFPHANIDISRINDACERIVGKHDFRNFCHIDNNKSRLEMSYVREIFHAHVVSMHQSEPIDGYNLLKLTVKASGFLWHQIRCIVTLLYEIGCGREELQLITDLFDVEQCPARPQYNLANELPLCLFDCSYADNNLQWVFDTQLLKNVLEHMQTVWADFQVKAAMLKSMIDGLSTLVGSTSSSIVPVNSIDGLQNFTLDHPPMKNYVPMLKRPRCQSLEERIEKNAKKMK